MLNMRTAEDGEPPPSDLTTQAKIRDAAIKHFAKDGFQQATLRAIAATAGVSAGLVVHHFGSKGTLRRVCDEYVLRDLTLRGRAEASPAGLRDVIRDHLANPAEYQVQIQYMARAISEDSPAARRFVDTLVDESEAIVTAGIADGSMRPSPDPRGVAVLITAISLATLTMGPLLAHSLGLDGSGPELVHRIALPSLELFTHGLYTDDSFLTVARDAMADSRPGTPGPSTTTT